VPNAKYNKLTITTVFLTFTAIELNAISLSNPKELDIFSVEVIFAKQFTITTKKAEVKRNLIESLKTGVFLLKRIEIK